jgi:hypothetical protein
MCTTVGYCAGHLRYKFIREEVIDDSDEADDGDIDRESGTNGAEKGSSSSSSSSSSGRETSRKQESEWYDCLATAPEGGISISAAWTSSDVRIEVKT